MDSEKFTNKKIRFMVLKTLTNWHHEQLAAINALQRLLFDGGGSESKIVLLFARTSKSKIIANAA